MDLACVKVRAALVFVNSTLMMPGLSKIRQCTVERIGRVERIASTYCANRCKKRFGSILNPVLLLHKKRRYISMNPYSTASRSPCFSFYPPAVIARLTVLLIGSLH